MRYYLQVSSVVLYGRLCIIAILWLAVCGGICWVSYWRTRRDLMSDTVLLPRVFQDAFRLVSFCYIPLGVLAALTLAVMHFHLVPSAALTLTACALYAFGARMACPRIDGDVIGDGPFLKE